MAEDIVTVDLSGLLAEVENGPRRQFKVGKESFTVPGACPALVPVLIVSNGRELDGLRLWLGEESLERFVAVWRGSWPQTWDLLRTVYADQGEVSASDTSSPSTSTRSKRTSTGTTA